MGKNKILKWIIIIATIAVAGVIVAVVVFLTNPSRRLSKLLDLGNQYLEACEYDQAIAAFEGALEIDPNCVEAYLGEGDAYIALGEYKRAIASYEEVLEIEPKTTKAYLGEADAYVALEDYENAITVLEKGYELTGKGQLKDQLDDIREGSKKAEETEKPFPAGEEENASTEQTEKKTDASINGELLNEPYPLAMQGFSDFKDEGDSFTVKTKIREAGYLPKGKFESMQDGESVNILGDEYIKINYIEDYGDYQQEVLESNDGLLYCMATEEYDAFFEDLYSFLKLDGMELMMLTGEEDFGFYNESLHPVATIKDDYELQFREDAVVELADGDWGTDFGRTVSAKEVLSGQYNPGSEEARELFYSDEWKSFWLFFDENGMVEKLVEVFVH